MMDFFQLWGLITKKMEEGNLELVASTMHNLCLRRNEAVFKKKKLKHHYSSLRLLEVNYLNTMQLLKLHCNSSPRFLKLGFNGLLLELVSSN